VPSGTGFFTSRYFIGYLFIFAIWALALVKKDPATTT